MRKLFALAAVVPLLFAGVAYADSLDFSSPTITPVGSDFLWNYDIIVDNAEHINTTQNAAFITLYDVNGLASAPTYVPNVAEPAGSATVQNVGLTPSLENPTDNPAIPNITVQYSGTSATAQDLGHVSFLDTIGGNNVTTGEFSAQATLNVDNSVSANTSSVPVPAPEPSSVLLVALGMAGLALKAFRR